MSRSHRFRKLLPLILVLVTASFLVVSCRRRDGIDIPSPTVESTWVDISGWDDSSGSWEDDAGVDPSDPSEKAYTALPPFPVSDGFRYHRSLLSSQDQLHYDEILDCILNFRESTEKMVLSGPEHLEKLFYSVSYDYPELFYVRTYVYYYWEDTSTYQLNPDYLFTREEAVDALEYMEDSVSDLVSQLWGYGEFDKAVAVYTYLVERFTYDLGYTGADLYQVLRDDLAVCEGYARASQFLLNRLGVENIYVTGTGLGPEGTPEAHAWNMVMVDGEYYNFDATWGELELADGTHTVQYNDCLMPDSIFLQSHFPEDFPYPACSSLDFNFYARHGVFLTYYDPNLLISLMGDAPNSLGTISFQCLYQQDYVNYRSLLENGDSFWNLIQQNYGDFYANRYQYYYDNDSYVIRLDFLKTDG